MPCPSLVSFANFRKKIALFIVGHNSVLKTCIRCILHIFIDVVDTGTYLISVKLHSGEMSF